MSSLSISLDGDYPFDYENLEEIYEAADRAVRWCRKHMKLEAHDFVQHRDDLLHTALLSLFQYRHSFRARAFAEAQYDLMTYVLVSIWGLKQERSSDVTRGYSVVLAEDLRTENYQEDQDMVDLPLPRQDNAIGQWKMRLSPRNNNRLLKPGGGVSNGKSSTSLSDSVVNGR